MKRHISFQRVEGLASRQAHAKLPEGTYEREMGKEGFFGPASHIYHKNPPTGWIDWEGPLRPRAFDLTLLNQIEASPWDAKTVLHNASVQVRFWRVPELMDTLARNGDGDELIFLHQGKGDLFCDFGHLEVEAGDYIMIPRGTMWRLESLEPMTALLIEATNGSYMLPEQGHARPARDLRPGHAGRADPGRGLQGSAGGCQRLQQNLAGLHQAPQRGQHRDPSPSTRWTPWAGKATWRRCASTCGTSARC